MQIACRPFILVSFILVSCTLAHRKRKVCEDVETEHYCKLNQFSCIQYGRLSHRMHHLCKKTCGVCKKEACEDEPGALCNSWNALGYCTTKNIFFKSMKQKCKKTCGTCESSTTSTATERTTLHRRRTEPTINVFTTATTKATSTKEIVPKECGVNKLHDSRIIGGTQSAPNSWVWQAGIYFYEEYICGGTLITSRHIITAAHCVIFRSKEGMTVILGDHDRDKTEGSEQELEVEDIVYHRDYSDSSLNNDIAIIKLKENVKINDDVGVACLPRDPPPSNSTCYITGWGLLNPGGISASILNEANMPIVDNKKCGERNKNDLGTSKVTENMLCAGFETDSKVSGCFGDSGGPFVCKRNASWVLHGVVSWGSPLCDANNRYTVFARVSRYIKWIKENLK